MIVQEDIENGLQALGLGRGDVVQVHSSQLIWPKTCETRKHRI
jgi:aminoglycoside N3'-acetyltransferase